MFFYMFGFYTAWMLGIAALAYQKLKGFDDYATHFVGRKDYGIIVMMLTMFASWISGNTITNVPNASSALGYTSFYITAAYCQCYLGWSWVAPRVRRFSVARQWNSFSDVIADRFRNPLVIICLLIFPVCSLEAYIIAQQWACRALIPVVSDGNMHEDRMTLFLTTVVYICESFGGFDAVSYTDVIQGCIMIISLLIGPSYMSIEFGILKGTCAFGCEKSWIETMEDPDNPNATIEKRRGCMAYRSPWNVVHPAGVTYSYYFKPKWPTYGVDKSFYFNNVGIMLISYYCYGAAYFGFPHVTCRLFASKSDDSCRKSMMLNIACALMCGIPGLMLGLFWAIHVERMYPAGTVTFAGILDFMMTKGGAPEFFACTAACGGVAGIMSTIDSSALAITNIVTKELVVNLFYRAFPHWDTHRFMTVIERCTTAFVLILGLFMTLVFLPARVEADPMEAKMMMNRIGFYQFGFVVQAMPGLLCVLFHPTIRPIPILLGLICGLTILPALSTAIFEKKFYGTDVPEGQPNNMYLHPTVTVVLINGTLVLVCNMVMPDGIANAFTWKNEKEPLTWDIMCKLMANTIEIVYNKMGWAAYFTQVMLTYMPCPFYGASYDNCNTVTYPAYTDHLLGKGEKPPDCEPREVTGSFPPHGEQMLGCMVVCYPVNIFQLWCWKPDLTVGTVQEETGAKGS